jgi:hypothetical protein
VAWACVTIALGKTQTPAEARALLAGMIEGRPAQEHGAGLPGGPLR